MDILSGLGTVTFSPASIKEFFADNSSLLEKQNKKAFELFIGLLLAESYSKTDEIKWWVGFPLKTPKNRNVNGSAVNLMDIIKNDNLLLDEDFDIVLVNIDDPNNYDKPLDSLRRLQITRAVAWKEQKIHDLLHRKIIRSSGNEIELVIFVEGNQRTTERETILFLNNYEEIPFYRIILVGNISQQANVFRPTEIYPRFRDLQSVEMNSWE